MNAAIRIALGLLATALILVGGCRSTTDRMRVLEAKKAEAERQQEELRRANAQKQAQLLQEQAEREKLEALLAAERERKAAEAAAEPAPAVTMDTSALRNLRGQGVSVRDNGTIVLASDVTFRPGRADLSGSAAKTLREVAQALKNVDQIGKIQIQGHTDADPIRKSGWKDNHELSLARAKQVQRFLMSQGIDGSVLEVEGYGADRPLGSNKTETGKAKNRRVEIILSRAE